MNKSGISAIVATVLVILITVAAIAMIWVAILPMIRQGLGFDALDGRVSVVDGDGYTIYDPAREVAIVQIRREVDEEVMNRNRVYFSIDGGSRSAVVDAPGPSETRVYAFDLEDCGEPDEVYVAPVFVSGSLEKEGAVSSRINVEVHTIDEILWDVNELEEGCVGAGGGGGSSSGVFNGVTINGIGGWWEFDGDATDSVSGNDGSLEDGADILGGTQLILDGVDDYVDIVNEVIVDGGPEYSACAWFKMATGGSLPMKIFESSGNGTIGCGISYNFL